MWNVGSEFGGVRCWGKWVLGEVRWGWIGLGCGVRWGLGDHLGTEAILDVL